MITIIKVNMVSIFTDMPFQSFNRNLADNCAKADHCNKPSNCELGELRFFVFATLAVKGLLKWR